MSFIPPPQSPLDLEAAKARVQEAQQRALRYAEEHHHGGAEPGAAGRQRLWRRLLRALSGRRSAE